MALQKVTKLKKTIVSKKQEAIKFPMTKNEIIRTIAARQQIPAKQVSGIFEELSIVIEKHVSKRGVGQFILPGLFKIAIVKKPATKAREGINPFTGEKALFKAKPARNVVKIRPLKKLKDMVV